MNNRSVERLEYRCRLANGISPTFIHRDALVSIFAMDLRFFDDPVFHDKRMTDDLYREEFSFDLETVTAAWNAAFCDIKYDLSNVAKKVVLNPREERTLFLQYNYARSQIVPLRDICLQRKLKKSEASAAWRWGVIAKRARDTLVVSNLGLVFSMGRRYGVFNNGDVNETITEGINALMRTVDCFNVGTGYKFSTYACRSIIQGMNRFKAKSAIRLQREFPSSLEITPECKVQEEKPESDEIHDLQVILRENRASLSDDEMLVVRDRYFDKQKLHEIGKTLCLSNERIRQIESKALKKLRLVMAA